MSMEFVNGFAIKKMRIYSTEPNADINIWSVENSAEECRDFDSLSLCYADTENVKKKKFTQTNAYWYDLDLSDNNGFYWVKDDANRYMIKTKDQSLNHFTISNPLYIAAYTIEEINHYIQNVEGFAEGRT